MLFHHRVCNALLLRPINKMIEQQQVLNLDFGLATEFLCSEGSEDTKEAMLAFVEKRKPRFTGR